MGHEFAGIIEEDCEGVTHVAAGQCAVVRPKIHPSPIINAIRSRTWADSVPFEVALDEIDPGDKGVGDMGMGMEGATLRLH
ncbi:hypothetical protein N7497_011304 [Penicillium chrysogenum]|nr:hypothetical protein N7497_011304 [Penicillium chrysogenum]